MRGTTCNTNKHAFPLYTCVDSQEGETGESLGEKPSKNTKDHETTRTLCTHETASLAWIFRW